VGWIKRGPSGLIGSNRACAQETVDALLEDVRDARLPVDGSLTADEVGALVRKRVPGLVEYAAWQLLDKHERSTGEPFGRPRVKVTRVSEMLEVIADDVSGTST
jgi:ferredoxin--NADP+ reductase